MAKENGTVIAAEKKEVRDFGWRDLVGYFMGDFGCNMSFTLISSYMFIFYTQYIGISLSHYAIIILITKILDGINDPLIGALVDKLGANKKGEKFKPWILMGSPLLAISAALLFLDVSAWGYGAKLALCIGGYVFWDIMYTIVNVPYGAMSSVMTTKSSQRTALSTARSWGGILAGVPLGIIIPMIAYKNVTQADGTVANIFQGDMMFKIAIVLGIISVIAFVILYMNTEERVKTVEVESEDKPKEKFSYIQTLKGFFKNRAILGVSFVSVMQLIFISGAGQLNSLTYQMYFRDGSLNSFGVLNRLMPLIIGTIIGGLLIKKTGKKELCSWPLLGSIATFTFMYFVPITNPYVFIALQVLGTSFGFGFTLYAWALVSDSIDYQEMITGSRNEGSVYATYSMLRKIAQGVTQSLVPAAIVWFIPTLDTTSAATWTVENVTMIKDMALLFPIIGYTLMFIGMTFIYNLDKKSVEEMQVKLGREEE